MTSAGKPAGSARLASILCWAAGLLVAVYALVAFAVAPAMYTDSAWGMLVSDSMKRGGPFNHLVEPAAEDLARESSRFIALWSPGQYLLPAVFEWMGLSLGSALVVVASLFTGLGLAGWHALYRRWGFSPLGSALAIALIAGSRALALPFGIYNGGEVLLFGTIPWFLLLLGKWRALSPLQAVGIFAALGVVAFMKLSGLVMAFAALAALVVCDLWPPSPARLRRPLMAALIAGAFAAVFHVLWLSRGVTAADGDGVAWADLLPRFVEGWAAAFLGMLSLGDLAMRLFQHPARPVLESLDMLYLAVGIPALALMVHAGRRLAGSHPDYVRFAGATALFYVLLMTAIYVRGGSINMEDRFFRPLSFMLLIGMVEAVMASRPVLRLPLAALAAASVIYGVGSYVVHAAHNLASPLGARGFRHHTLTHDGLALLKKELAGPLDQADTVVWVTSPEIALEILHARVIPADDTPGEFTDRSYMGRVGRAFVVVPAAFVADGRATALLKALRGYDPDRWAARSSGSFTLYSQ